MKRAIQTLIVGTTAFAGGMITALLLTPTSGKENRKLVSEYGKETKDWLEDRSRKIREDSEKHLDRVSKGIRKTVKDAVPDLYEATENLDFTEEEEIEEITRRG